MLKLNCFYGLCFAALFSLLASCGGGGGSSGGSTTPDVVTPDIQTLLILTGQVVEQDSLMPLANAKVSVEGTSNQTMTDEDGYFNLSTSVSPEILLNTTAPNYTSSQKVLDLRAKTSDDVPFSNITLKSTRLVDTMLLTSLASSGKKNAEASMFALTEVDLDANTEQDLVPGNSGTNLADTMVDFLALKEIQAVRTSTNELTNTSFSDFSYDLIFEFIAMENEDLASLILWRYNIKTGKWEPQTSPNLISANLEETKAIVVYQVKAMGWYALGKKLQDLAGIKGQVVDQNAKPITNAKVIIEGQSFKGQITTITNDKGIFNAKVKAGSTLKVHASKGAYKTDAKWVTLKNYNHNHGGVAENTYCQPTGPLAGDPFYLKHPDFSNLAPPAGFEPSANLEELPLTLVMFQHTIKGAINYMEDGVSKPVPAKNNFVKLKNLGTFPLQSDGVLDISLPITKPVESLAQMEIKIDDKFYAGQVSFFVDFEKTETSFALLLSRDSQKTISGVVTLDGSDVPNAGVFLSTGIRTFTDNTGFYSMEVPSSSIGSDTTIMARFIDIGSETEYFSTPIVLTDEETQKVNIELKSTVAVVSGLVFDSLGGAISGASIKLLLDGLPISVQTQTNEEGAYAIKVPLKPNKINALTILALHKQEMSNVISQGFTTLNIDSTSITDSVSAEYTAEKIILDIRKNHTTVIGKVLVNEVPAQGVTVVFDHAKVMTNDSGSFKAIVAPGKNTLALFYGNEPLILSETNSNTFVFTATAEQENDVGNLKVTTSKKMVVFSKLAFQASEDPNGSPIKSILASDTNFAFLHVTAKGSGEAPDVSVDSALASLVSEVKTPEKSLTEQIYKVVINKEGTITINCKASQSSGESISSALSLMVLGENKPPVIVRTLKEGEFISNTNTTGFSVAVEAYDPEKSPLTFSWKIESPANDGVSLEGANLPKALLFTKDTKATEVVLVITVSDGSKSVSRKVLIPVNKRSLAVTSFSVSPEGVVSPGSKITLSVTVDDNILLQSILVDWGDSSGVESLKKGKTFNPTHTYEKEGDYTITITAVEDKGNKTSFNRSVKVSSTYVAPLLAQGMLTTEEDVAVKMDLSKLISNFDAKKQYVFSLVKKPAHGSVSISGLGLVYTPNLNFNGFDQFLLKVSDGVAFSDEVDVKVSVKAVNDPPVMSSSSADTTVGTTILIDLKKLVTDPDETDHHTFKIVTEPVLGTASIEGNILRYLANSAGGDKLTVVANDQVVDSNHATQFIKVLEVASELKLEGGEYDVLQNKELVIDLSKHLSNPNKLPSIVYAITQKGVLGEAMISGDKLIYKPAKNITGKESLFLIAKSDSVSSEPALFTIFIQPTVTAPVLIDSTASVNVGDELTLDLTKMIVSYDPQRAYTFKFADKGKPTKGDCFIEGLSLKYKAFSGSSGIDKLSLVATADNLLSNIATITLTLEQNIQPPVITSLPEKTATEGNLYTYKVIANHPNNLELTFSLEKAPVWLTNNKNLLSGTPKHKDVGLHNVSISVTDGTNIVYQNYTVEVNDVNFAPVIKSKPPTIASAGLLYSYLPNAIDPDDDELVWSLKDGPVGMTVDKATGEVLWTPSGSDPLENSVIIHVSDGVNLVSQKWVLVLSVTPPKIIKFTASDPDHGDAVFGNGDVITIDFDQATNTPPVKTKENIDALFKFNESIGLGYGGKWLSKSRLQIVISNAGSAKPKIGVLKVGVLTTGNLKNEAGTSDPSKSVSDVIIGDWGK